MESRAHERHHASNTGPYFKLLAMIVLMFVAMFALMYAMVDRFDNVHANLNQIYMAALMTAAMVLIELAVMRGMYPDVKANVAIIAASVLVLAASWFGIREQSAIGDRQFLRSMIPHHAGAILMCEQAPIEDPRIQALCGEILQSQREEIRRMEALLDED